MLARRGDDVWAEREVGHELSVHHVPLDPVDSRGFRVRPPRRPASAKSAGNTLGAISMGRGIDLEGSGCLSPYSSRLQSTSMSSIVVRAEKMAAGGDAIGHLPDGRVVFVRGALPGETVAIDVVQSKKDFARAEVVEVVEASADRVEPPCPAYHAGCGGCTWQHVAPSGAARPEGRRRHRGTATHRQDRRSDGRGRCKRAAVGVPNDASACGR